MADRTKSLSIYLCIGRNEARLYFFYRMTFDCADSKVGMPNWYIWFNKKAMIKLVRFGVKGSSNKMLPRLQEPILG